ncbi:MAG: MBL fold metallo-hydrolase [Cryomorphaceae bacterium]
MVHIKQFEFSPFQENTYVLYSDQKNCWIIDPGCYYPEEKQALADFIATEGLTPTRLLNTHCHLDHVFGNAFVHDTYGLKPQYHKKDVPTMKMAPVSASMYGIPGFDPSPEPETFLKEGETLTLDGHRAELRFCPGHAPGHLIFVFHEDHFIIGGDVLFKGSIGRTDLPGGDHATLLESIRKEVYVLPDDFKVYSGHGPVTTVGEEKRSNPFVRDTNH